MHVKAMEGLMGAAVNVDMMKVPMRIYREAERRGDLGMMERSMQYATEFSGRKEEYQEKMEQGMELEQEERKEEERRERAEKQKNPSEAVSLEISPEGKAALLSETENVCGKEETGHEDNGYTEDTGDRQSAGGRKRIASSEAPVAGTGVQSVVSEKGSVGNRAE